MNKNMFYRKNTAESIHIVENLKQDAEYVIRVAAVTVSGSGIDTFSMSSN